MSEINIRIGHHLKKGEALDRMKGLLGQLKQEHSGQITGLQESWSDDGGQFSMSAHGLRISGSLLVADTQVIFRATLPWQAFAFKGKIESMICTKASKILAQIPVNQTVPSKPAATETGEQPERPVTQNDRLRRPVFKDQFLKTVLFRRPVRKFCNKCQMYIPSTLPWTCSYCDHNHSRVRLYTYLYKCKRCKRAPVSIKCPHCDATLPLIEGAIGSHPARLRLN